MKKGWILIVFAFVQLSGQKINYEEYDLNNGLHVILHQNLKTPNVSVGVLYHVGSKNEEPGKTGMAHFFEHLLFEGSENIERGEFFKIVNRRGGSNNAFTTQDITYYYETFPSNEVELGLWLEAERMRHPVIDVIGVETQNEVVKEEKRTRIDNVPYGKIYYGEINSYLFQKHPYKNAVIGSMEDLDSQKLSDFLAFKDRWYSPSNATLVIAGNFDTNKLRDWVDKYFSDIPSAPKPILEKAEEPLLKAQTTKVYDSNITTPALVYNFRYGKAYSRSAYSMTILSDLLSSGKTSRLHKKLVDKEKVAFRVLSYTQDLEDHGIYRIVALPTEGTSLDELKQFMDYEIERLQEEEVSDREFQKIRNNLEASLLKKRQSVKSIAIQLAKSYAVGGDTKWVNKEIDTYKSIDASEIKKVAQEILSEKNRVIIEYLPKTEEK